MWFNPAEISKAPPTAKSANSANYRSKEENETPQISKLARLAIPSVSNFLSVATEAMTKYEESLIVAWLTYIKETDAEVIADVLARCRIDSGTRSYFLNCANTSEVIALQAEQAAREAAAERAAILEIDGGLSRIRAEKAAALFEVFYAHLMGVGKETNCCYASNDRYCTEGRRLRDAYHGALS